MESAAREGSALAQKVLTFARARKRPQSLVNLTSLIEEAITLVSRTLPKTVTVKQNVQANLRINADRTELLQVLINLLLNARDAMPRGGTLRIEGSAAQLDEIQAQEVGLSGPGETVVMKVKDTGIGMEEETRKRVFEPLFTTKESGRGTGLGLSMVYRIIEGQNGQILVDSKPGKGTQFSIYLPVGSKGDSGIQQARTTQVLDLFGPGRSTRPGGGLVLLLDFEEVMRQRAARVLNTLGFEMVTVKSPMELVDLLNQFHVRIKLVILNLDTLEEDGATTFLRLQSINPEIKVLFTTSTDKEPPRLEPDALRYLKTPCDTKTFQEAITEALS
jgi:CheY-like chemotaxis protein/two-component sensor histidine kinase